MSKENEMRATSNVNRKADGDGMNQEMREHIQKRAYQLFEAGGGEHGHDIEHWMQAEQEIMQKTQLHRAA